MAKKKISKKDKFGVNVTYTTIDEKAIAKEKAKFEADNKKFKAELDKSIKKREKQLDRIVKLLERIAKKL